MPNYLTVDSQSQVPPVSWKEKFAMAAKGSFDPYEFTIVGIVAGIRQAENSSPGFGQGFEGIFEAVWSGFRRSGGWQCHGGRRFPHDPEK